MADTVNFTISVPSQRVPGFVELLRQNNYRSVTVQYNLFTDDPVIPVLVEEPLAQPGETNVAEDAKLFDGSIEHEMARQPKKTRVARPPKTPSASTENLEDDTVEQFVIIDDPANATHPQHAHAAATHLSRRLGIKKEIFTPTTSPVRKRFAGVQSGSEESDVNSPLATHEKNRLKAYDCRECGVSVPRCRTRVMDHVVTQHSKIRNLKCPICKREGARMGNMVKHIQTVHGCMDSKPIDVANHKKRMAWNDILNKCFPDFPDQLAFNKQFRLF